MIKRYYNKFKTQYYTNKLKKKYYDFIHKNSIHVIPKVSNFKVNDITLYSINKISISYKSDFYQHKCIFYLKVLFDDKNNIIDMKEYRKLGPSNIKNNEIVCWYDWKIENKIGPSKIRKSINKIQYFWNSPNLRNLQPNRIAEEKYWNE